MALSSRLVWKFVSDTLECEGGLIVWNVLRLSNTVLLINSLSAPLSHSIYLCLSSLSPVVSLSVSLYLSLQVTGELSIGGRAMRAFVQTFVLAPESPKKYYVHNDIFRYQDDDEGETSDGPGE